MHWAGPCIFAFIRHSSRFTISYNTSYGSALAMDIDYNYEQSIENNYLETLEKIRYQLRASKSLHPIA